MTSFGALGDGITVGSAAVRAAAAAVADLSAHGGGVLLFPSGGVYLTGPFNLSSNSVLRVESGATILGNSNDTADPWPLLDAGAVWPQFGHGSDCIPGSAECRLMHQALIFAWQVTNVTIEGSGTIDAQGGPFWACASSLTAWPCSGHGRPHLLMISNATDVVVREVTVKNSPDWTLHFSSVDHLHVDSVSVRNPHTGAANSDGIDLDCVQHAVVENSYFDVGDDALCIKSGIDWYGRTYGRESAHIIFRNNTIGAGHGITIGSETSGGVSNVTFEGLVLVGTNCGPRIKSQRGRGGVVSGIIFRNITAFDLSAMLCVTLNYHAGLAPTNWTATPRLRGVLFEGIRFLGGHAAGGFDGLPESPIENVTLRDVTFPTGGKPLKFSKCEHIVGGVCEGTTNLCPPCFDDRTRGSPRSVSEGGSVAYA